MNDLILILKTTILWISNVSYRIKMSQSLPFFWILNTVETSQRNSIVRKKHKMLKYGISVPPFQVKTELSEAKNSIYKIIFCCVK